jgi:hypothetical protein
MAPYFLHQSVTARWGSVEEEGAFQFGVNDFRFVALRVLVNGQMFGVVHTGRSDGPPHLEIFQRNLDEFLERLISPPSDLIYAIGNIWYISWIMHHLVSCGRSANTEQFPNTLYFSAEGTLSEGTTANLRSD